MPSVCLWSSLSRICLQCSTTKSCFSQSVQLSSASSVQSGWLWACCDLHPWKLQGKCHLTIIYPNRAFHAFIPLQCYFISITFLGFWAITSGLPRLASSENICNMGIAKAEHLFYIHKRYSKLASRCTVDWGMDIEAKVLTAANQRVKLLWIPCKLCTSLLSRSFAEWWGRHYPQNLKAFADKWKSPATSSGLTDTTFLGGVCDLLFFLDGGSVITWLHCFKVIFPLPQQVLQPDALAVTDVTQFNKISRNYVCLSEGLLSWTQSFLSNELTVF